MVIFRNRQWYWEGNESVGQRGGRSLLFLFVFSFHVLLGVALCHDDTHQLVLVSDNWSIIWPPTRWGVQTNCVCGNKRYREGGHSKKSIPNAFSDRRAAVWHIWMRISRVFGWKSSVLGSVSPSTLGHSRRHACSPTESFEVENVIFCFSPLTHFLHYCIWLQC